MKHHQIEGYDATSPAHWSAGTNGRGNVLVQVGDDGGEQCRVRLTPAEARRFADQLIVDAEKASLQNSSLDCEDQYQAWRIGRDCLTEGYAESDAIKRVKGVFPQSEQLPFFNAGFSGKECPVLTAKTPE